VQFEWIPTYAAVSQAPGLDAHRVYPGLWQGSVPPTGSAVRRAGFDALVLAATTAEYRYCYGAEPDERLFPGVMLHSADLDDADLSDAEHRRARAAAHFVARVLKMKGRVLTTCMQGRNRSGLISALAIRELTRASGKACIDQVRRARSNALTNPSFVAALEKLS